MKRREFITLLGAGATGGVAAGRGWVRLHWWLRRLRWRRVTLPEVWILRFAICHELRIDLWQRLGGLARLRRSSHDGRHAIHKKAVAGPALHKSRLLASCPDFSAGPLAWGRLHGDSRTQTDDKRNEDGSPNLISVHLLLRMSASELTKS
jgi:hypothetical protein